MDMRGLMLTTPSDLNHSNQYIVGLALCTLGNIASVEMARDLFPEVETIIASSNPYIRRKAAICAMRICRKVPDLQEHFLEKAKLLLQDRNHGVLLCGITLVANLCEADELEDDESGVRDLFKPVVPSLVKILKGLSSSGYAPEHDVTGITDPFLQCKILQLLRVLARGDVSVSEQINDILAQVQIAHVMSITRAKNYRSPLTRTRRKTSATPSCTRRCSRFLTLRLIRASACLV
jgi:AP-1 complex subunit gamma-1